MVPNPIYSGNPIYDEIDPSFLKFLNKGDSGTQSRDESYVQISGNPASALKPSDICKDDEDHETTPGPVS